MLNYHISFPMILLKTFVISFSLLLPVFFSFSLYLVCPLDLLF
jgi:hypothetical protein